MQSKNKNLQRIAYICLLSVKPVIMWSKNTEKNCANLQRTDLKFFPEGYV